MSNLLHCSGAQRSFRLHALLAAFQYRVKRTLMLQTTLDATHTHTHTHTHAHTHARTHGTHSRVWCCIGISPKNKEENMSIEATSHLGDHRNRKMKMEKTTSAKRKQMRRKMTLKKRKQREMEKTTSAKRKQKRD
jgi:hypothetical protein